MSRALCFRWLLRERAHALRVYREVFRGIWRMASPMTGEYRRQAAFSKEMADRASLPGVKADWLHLASKWLAMIPSRESTATERFDEMTTDKGIHQQNSTSQH
jgi:hypothetical protein